jgi:hypothetical protein
MKSKIYSSLKYLLTHEYYVDLSINEKINQKTQCFNFDRSS